jgi:hypothetical protein
MCLIETALGRTPQVEVGDEGVSVVFALEFSEMLRPSGDAVFRK